MKIRTGIRVAGDGGGGRPSHRTEEDAEGGSPAWVRGTETLPGLHLSRGWVCRAAWHVDCASITRPQAPCPPGAQVASVQYTPICLQNAHLTLRPGEST